MARARNIKPGICLNDVLAGLAHWVGLLFVYLSTVADRAGRLVDNPRRIGAAVFPYEPGLPLNEGLQQLHDTGFIRRYVVDGESFIQIANWGKHQNPHPKEAESTIPEPPAMDSNEPATEKPRLVTEMPKRAGLIPSSLIPSSRPSQHFEDELQKFLAEYPNQIGLDEAARQWISLVPSEITTESVADILAGLERWKDSEQWQNEDGKYIPAPGKWLRERRWKDHPKQKADDVYHAPPASSEGSNPYAEWRPDWLSKKPEPEEG